MATERDDLRTYRKKRDFKRTPEPAGKPGTKPRATSRAKRAMRFVIQKHAATALHYDFRLEVDGVMKSWAIPRGPSMNPRDKRLAMPTEDHPIAYNRFEGVIPEGNYGAGEVIIWDRGTYRNTTEKDGRSISAREAIENGHLTFEIEGEKVRGSFALTRVGARGGRPKWLLVKKRDEHAREDTSFDERSVVTGRTLDDLSHTG